MAGIIGFKSNKWTLVLYDLISFICIASFMFYIYEGSFDFESKVILFHIFESFAAIFICRFLFKIYRQIWRYGGISCFLRLMLSDGTAFILAISLNYILPIGDVSFEKILCISCLNLIVALGMRMTYRYAYKNANDDSGIGIFLKYLLKIFTAGEVTGANDECFQDRINAAIIGAGNVGVILAGELKNNPMSTYNPVCFIDIDGSKVGRDIGGLPVIKETDANITALKEKNIKEVIFAIPGMPFDKKKALYEYYSSTGLKVKVYDYPALKNAGKKKVLRDFDIEELLFRKPIDVVDEKTSSYYKNKTILVTGGGGSIGSEIVRQLAFMKPSGIVILDIYENGAYELQQELRFIYGQDLNLAVEIVSVTSEKNLNIVFEKYRPDIVINAAAHKHVPLMENNCVEAVENNVFGTLNTVKMCEKYHVERYMMVSTDKAVNPTNVMGATKRMCEMIVSAYSAIGKTKYSTTRFGNVLGSNGSVIPLFKNQISSGGPVTITDKRIIRYFMTISEASQLVLQSGRMAQNGELFVLDMGQPVKILDLAVSMIKLSGLRPYIDIDIEEIGLRPGEKLYEELLVKKEELTRTENELIFIEKEETLTMEELALKLHILEDACKAGDNDGVRDALRKVVETFRDPEAVNTCV